MELNKTHKDPLEIDWVKFTAMLDRINFWIDNKNIDKDHVIKCMDYICNNFERFKKMKQKNIIEEMNEYKKTIGANF